MCPHLSSNDLLRPSAFGSGKALAASAGAEGELRARVRSLEDGLDELRAQEGRLEALREETESLARRSRAGLERFEALARGDYSAGAASERMAEFEGAMRGAFADVFDDIATRRRAVSADLRDARDRMAGGCAADVPPSRGSLDKLAFIYGDDEERVATTAGSSSSV